MTKRLIFIAIVVAVVGAAVWLYVNQTPPPEEEAYMPVLDASTFSNVVDNPLLTLAPGQKLVYEGQTEEGLERIEVTVTTDTKTVMGIEAVVVHDQVFLDGELIEDTFDWYAEDAEGNVWYLGEDTKELDGGEVVSTEGSWEAGVDGAQPGVVMWAHPELGQAYRQEYYAGKAEDMGEIVALGETVETAFGTFEGCLKTRDWTPLEAQVDEYKWYCPAIGGLVLEEGIYSGERIELVEVI